MEVAKIFRDPTRVVTCQSALPVPIVTVAVRSVLTDPLVVRRTCTVWPEEIAPEVTQAPPLMLISGLPPPETEATTDPVKPVMVGVLLCTIVLRDWSVNAVNVKALGVWSLVSATGRDVRSEEHTSELQSRFGISYAVFC